MPRELHLIHIASAWAAFPPFPLWVGSLRIQPNHATNAQSQSIHFIVYRLVIRHVVAFSLSCRTFLAMSSYPFCHTGVFVYHVDVHDSLYCCTRLQYYCTRFPRCYSRLPNCCTRMLCRCTHFAIMLSLAAMSLGLFAMLLYPLCHVVVPPLPCCIRFTVLLDPFAMFLYQRAMLLYQRAMPLYQSRCIPVDILYRRGILGTFFAPNHLLLVTQVGLETALCGWTPVFSPCFSRYGIKYLSSEDALHERERERERELKLELENLNTCVRFIWTYLTTSPCYTTNTNKHNTTNKYYKHD